MAWISVRLYHSVCSDAEGNCNVEKLSKISGRKEHGEETGILLFITKYFHILNFLSSEPGKNKMKAAQQFTEESSI